MNGDGYADVIVGAVWYDAGETDEGAAFVFLGSASGIVAAGNPGNAASQLEADQVSAYLGKSVAGAGDVNGDGYADVIVGARKYDGGQTDEGAAFVFLGGASGIVAAGSPSNADSQLESDQVGAIFGYSVASAGDVNGDGYADAIVGSLYYDAGESDEGAAFVFLGNGDGDGRSVLARQQGVGMAPVPPISAWGRSNSPDEIQIEMNATHPAGRGRVKLEIETCPPGVPFEDASCSTYLGATWIDVMATSSGVTLTETVPIEFGTTLVRWRARVLHAPLSVTQSGITAPANPAHGPWRRLSGQANEGDVRRQLDDAVAIAGGANVTESLLGGPGSWGGVDVDFPSAGAGTLSGGFTPIPAGPAVVELVTEPESINFLMPGDPVQLWDVSFDGSFTPPITLTFQYDDANLAIPESALEVFHYTGSAWEELPLVSQDTVANTVTVTTTSLSPFILGGPVDSSIGWELSGTALGGSVDLMVGAVFLSVATTPGQTAEQVATAVAAAINADPTLSGAGITAVANGGTVTTTGAITWSEIADTGLSGTLLYPEVPALGVFNLLLAAGGLMLATFAMQRSRSAP